MSQPEFKCRYQLWDADPLEYGGYWIFEDTTGVYDPEGELYDPESGMAWRFSLDPCTYIEGVLSDNEFHPNRPAWFADKIDALASFIGYPAHVLIGWFVSTDIIRRAQAWRVVGDYFGFDNLDGYPLELTRKEAAERYTDPRYTDTLPICSNLNRSGPTD